MKQVLTVVFISFFAYFGSTQNTSSYFAKYKKLADSLSVTYGIPSCVILGVAYHESGGGTSILAKKLHNHFGIKGDCNFAVSHHKSSYKYYPKVEDSYIGFCKLVANKKMYAQMKGSTDCQLWLKKIAATGYAANASKWSGYVNSIIRRYCQ
ncbi:MAG: glucosaminidase domain-containing protein [Bacteroidetes bacterium]|nr:glucosaminidase domain-containing protein [Bacteroidota bacterium]